MTISDLSLAGVKAILPEYFEDYRGYYVESYSAKSLAIYGIDTVFVQDNHVFTLKSGTIRGLHFQNNPRSQAKLVRCIRGTVLDIIVDLRRGSPAFKHWVSIILSEGNRKQVYIPNGFGHAFLSLTDGCEVLYKVDDFYEPPLDRAIKWNDPEIGITWPIENPIVSPKDENAPFLKDSDVNFTMEANG